MSMCFESDCGIKPEIISPDDGYHYFFGYYDMRADDGSGRHLCHRVSFIDKLPLHDDIAEVGYLENKKFIKIGETTAWNFQQGAMLEYHPVLKDTVYYNIRKDGKVVTLIHNFRTGEMKTTDRACACFSPDGKYGISVNFARIYDFRPGYGYAGIEDPGKDTNAPENDGVFLTDMESEKSRLIIPYDRLSKLSGFEKCEKVLVNHVTFSPDSKKYIMLVRSFPAPERPWRTSLVCGDINGNVSAVFKKTYASHYRFIDENRLVIHCTADNFSDPFTERRSMYIIDLRDNSFCEHHMPYFDIPGGGDIHCNVSPDKKYIIGDGYPESGMRPLLAYNYESHKSRMLFKAKTIEPEINDIRCDLHARFVSGGKISFDTTHNGKREIACIAAEALDF